MARYQPIPLRIPIHINMQFIVLNVKLCATTQYARNPAAMKQMKITAEKIHTTTMNTKALWTHYERTQAHIHHIHCVNITE